MTFNRLYSASVWRTYIWIPEESYTIDIAVKIICDNEPTLKISTKELKTLFEFATSSSHFSFKNNIFDQTDGVAMGSPLGPVLANIFMGHHEKTWLQNYHGIKPEVYTRYVDDIFAAQFLWKVLFLKMLTLEIFSLMIFVSSGVLPTMV